MTGRILGWLRARRMNQMVASYARVHLLRTGAYLGLFDALRERSTADALAERLGLAEDLVAAWLRAAEANGLVRGDTNGGFTTTGFVRWMLDAEESASLFALLEHAALTEGPTLDRLPDLMKGAARPSFGAPEEAARAAEGARVFERRALEKLSALPGARDARHVLDIGCGYATSLVGFLLRHRDAHGLGVERDPEVAEEARRRIEEAGVGQRAEIRVGDFMTMDVPKGTFDLILLSGNLHYFPPAEHGALFRRALARLRDGGVLAIQTPVVSRGPLARAEGLAPVIATWDLVQRAHHNLYPVPDPKTLSQELRACGFDRVGEMPIAAGGAIRFVWARARLS